MPVRQGSGCSCPPSLSSGQSVTYWCWERRWEREGRPRPPALTTWFCHPHRQQVRPCCHPQRLCLHPGRIVRPSHHHLRPRKGQHQGRPEHESLSPVLQVRGYPSQGWGGVGAGAGCMGEPTGSGIPRTHRPPQTKTQLQTWSGGLPHPTPTTTPTTPEMDVRARVQYGTPKSSCDRIL